MKVLFAVQGTGNGHISRANQIYPVLQQYAQVDVLLSGTEHAVKARFPVKYAFKGLGFVFGKMGGIDYVKTYAQARLWRFLKSIEEVPVRSYDLIINDFEPITAWACKLRKVPIVALSHQAALLKPQVPKPENIDLAAEILLRHYAPAEESIGFHFDSYHTDILTPVIRDEIYQSKRKPGNHITVYLPAFSPEILLDTLPVVRGISWQVFTRTKLVSTPRPDITLFPVNNNEFARSMTNSAGIICGAGFETPSEALHMGIPLLAVPMRGQYEQACNAAALENAGVKVIWKTSDFNSMVVKQWIEERKEICKPYPAVVEQALEKIFELYEKLKQHERDQNFGIKRWLAS